MALGPQFENTYWFNEEGKPEVSKVQKGLFSDLEVARRGAPYEPKDIPSNMQGMLFSPETGTGMKGDPLVPQARRDAAIERGLGFSDMEKYKSDAALKRSYNSRKITPVGTNMANQAKSAYSKALDSSNMPTHVIESTLGDKPVISIMNTDMSRAHIENYIIRLPGHKKFEYTQVPEKTDKVPVNPTLVAIPNYSWREQSNKIDWESAETARSELNDIATVFTPEGHPFQVLDGFSKPTSDKNLLDKIPKALIHKQYPEIEDVRNLPSGFTTNLWVGNQPRDFKRVTDPIKGKTSYVPETEKPIKAKKRDPFYKDSLGVVSEGHNIYNGIDYYGNEKTRRISTKHKIVGAEQFETITTPARRIRTGTTYEVSPASLVHELGHYEDTTHKRGLLDQRRAHDSGRPDPASEGVADGYRDAYERNVLQRAYTGAETGTSYTVHGYGTEFSGFKGNTDKALYAALRIHTAAHPDKINEVPSRAGLMGMHAEGLAEAHPNIGKGNFSVPENTKQMRDIGGKLLLGHLYENHAHVRKTLEDLGYGDTGRSAHEYYKSVQPKKQPQGEQLQLPGIEDQPIYILDYARHMTKVQDGLGEYGRERFRTLINTRNEVEEQRLAKLFALDNAEQAKSQYSVRV